MKTAKSDGKSASLTLTLKSDSGYRSTETHRIDVEQWTSVLMVCVSAETFAAMKVAPDLLAALKLARGALGANAARDAADAAIAKAEPRS